MASALIISHHMDVGDGTIIAFVGNDITIMEGGIGGEWLIFFYSFLVFGE